MDKATATWRQASIWTRTSGRPRLLIRRPSPESPYESPLSPARSPCPSAAPDPSCRAGSPSDGASGETCRSADSPPLPSAPESGIPRPLPAAPSETPPSLVSSESALKRPPSPDSEPDRPSSESSEPRKAYHAVWSSEWNAEAQESKSPSQSPEQKEAYKASAETLSRNCP